MVEVDPEEVRRQRDRDPGEVRGWIELWADILQEIERELDPYMLRAINRLLRLTFVAGVLIGFSFLAFLWALLS